MICNGSFSVFQRLQDCCIPYFSLSGLRAETFYCSLVQRASSTGLRGMVALKPAFCFTQNSESLCSLGKSSIWDEVGEVAVSLSLPSVPPQKPWRGLSQAEPSIFPEVAGVDSDRWQSHGLFWTSWKGGLSRGILTCSHWGSLQVPPAISRGSRLRDPASLVLSASFLPPDSTLTLLVKAQKTLSGHWKALSWDRRAFPRLWGLPSLSLGDTGKDPGWGSSTIRDTA